jgi:hypothetical protein
VQLRTVERFSCSSVYCYCPLLYELISDILLVIIQKHLIFHNLRPIIIVVDRPEVWTTNKRHSLSLMHNAMCNQWHVGCTSCTLEAVTYTLSFYDEGRNNNFQYTYVSRHRPNYTVSYKNTSMLILTALSTSKSHKPELPVDLKQGSATRDPRFHFVPPVDIWLHVNSFYFQDSKNKMN